MIIKLFLVIGVILLYFFLGTSHQGKKTYYFLTVIFLLIRELNVPYLGEVTPVGVMTALIFIGTFSLNNRYLKKWGVYFGYLVLSLIIAYAISPYSYRAFEWAYTLFVVMALAVIPPFLLDDEKDLVTLTRCVVFTCLVFSLTTISAFYGYADGTIIIAGSEIGEVGNDIRNSRIYGLTNTNLINCICAISIIFLPWAKIKRKRIEWAIILITIYAGLLTLKRMTSIALLISLMLYVMEQGKGGKKIWAFFVVALAVVAFFSIFGDEFLYRFGLAGFGSGDVEDSSAQTRLDRSFMAIDELKQSPIFGCGAGHLIYIHNGFFEILANCGILGVIIIFFRYLPKWKDVKVLNPWALSILLFLITIFMLESAINHIQLMGFLGVFLGGYYMSIKYNWSIKTIIQK